MQDRTGARDERERDGNHLVTGSDTEGQQSQVDRGRSRACGNCMRRADEVGESLLELADALALCQHARRQRAGDELLLLGTHLRTCDRNHS